jgi:glycosyltransferase involved in cell wall biosynthesis
MLEKVALKERKLRKVSAQYPQPIRVLHVIDKLSVAGSGIHGVTKAVERWILQFDPEEYQFCVCSLRSPEIAGQILAEKGIQTLFLSRSKFDPRTLTDLLKLVKKERIDILHLHGYAASNFGRLTTLITGIPNIVHEHAVLPNQPLYQTIADTLLSGLTTRAIACSKSVETFMHQHRKIRPSILETVNNGLPVSEFQAYNPQDLVYKRQQLGLRPDCKVVTTVGRLDVQKGHVYLLEAIPAILQQLPNTHFLIVGEGPLRGEIEAKIHTLGITENVTLTGFRQDAADLMALSDVIAMPSLWEGLPLSLLEAMQLRKPVVGTPADGMKDVIQDGETGFLIPFKQSQPLAEKLIVLLSDPQLLQQMGKAAQKRCQRYDIAHSVQRLDTLYRELANVA